jgi:hypothetical protein
MSTDVVNTFIIKHTFLLTVQKIYRWIYIKKIWDEKSKDRTKRKMSNKSLET